MQFDHEEEVLSVEEEKVSEENDDDYAIARAV